MQKGSRANAKNPFTYFREHELHALGVKLIEGSVGNKPGPASNAIK